MKTLFLLLLIMFALPLFMVITKQKKFDEYLIVSVFLIPLLVYIFGLTGYLKLSFYFIILLTTILYIYTVIFIIRKKPKIKSIIDNTFTPAFVIWLILFFFIAIINKDRLFIGNDEFSHWGDVIRVMFNFNTFATNSASLSMFKEYVPGIACLQYFIMILNGEFVEWYAYVGISLVYITLLLPFLSALKWKNWFNILLSFFAVLVMPLILTNTFYYSLTVDGILGITAGAIIAFVLAKCTYKKYDIILLSILCGFLVLIKSAGIALALIIFIMILVDLLFFRKDPINCKNLIKKIFKKMKPLIIIMSSTLIIYLSWSILLKISNVYKYPSSPINITELINIILGKSTSYRQIVFNIFLDALRNHQVVYLDRDNISLGFFLIIIILFSIVAGKELYKKDIKRYLCINIIIYLGLLLYAFALLLLYFCKFSEYEALQLASWARYIGIYLNLILSSLLFIVIFKNAKSKCNYCLLLISLFLFYYSIDNAKQLVNYKQSIINTHQIRAPYEIAEKTISNTLHNKKIKLFLISQNTTGYDFYLLKYSLQKNLLAINPYNWSIGIKYYEEDIWTKYATADSWREDLINNYDYVYILKQDQQFIDQFSALFPKNVIIANDQLYKVKKQENAILELISK